MVCKSCGKELEDDAKFCDTCGTKVEIEELKKTEETATEEAVTEVPAEEKTAESEAAAPAEEKTVESEAAAPAEEKPAEPEAVAPAEEMPTEPEAVAPVFANPTPELTREQVVNIASTATKSEEKAQKNAGSFFKKFWFLFVIVGVIAIIAVVIVANFKYITNAIMKSGSSDTYFKWLAKNYVEERTDESIELYNSYKEIMNFSDEKLDANVSVEFGDEADKYLKLAKQAGYDFTWVETAGLSLELNSKEEIVDYTVGASFNGVEVLKVDYITDLKNEEEYIGFPSVESAYGEEESDYAEDLVEFIDEFTALSDAMPDKKIMRKLILRYLETAIDQVKAGNVKVSDKTLRAGGITQELTAVTLTVDNDLCQKVALAIVQQMQEDEELREVIEQYISDIEDTEYAEDMNLEDFDYDDFLDELSDYEDEIEDTDFMVTYDWRTGEKVEQEVEYTLFVNKKGEIVGYELVYESEDDYNNIDYKCYKVQKGSEVAYKLDYDYVVITATGKESGNKFTGDIAIEYSSLDVVAIEVTKFDIDGLKKGKLSGKFVVIPDESIFRYVSMGSNYEDMILTIDADIDIKKGKLSIALEDDEELVAKLNLDYKITSGSKIKLPASKDTIDMDDDDGGEELFESMNLDLLVEALEKAGAPDDVIDAVDDIEDYDDFEDFMDDLF